MPGWPLPPPPISSSNAMKGLKVDPNTNYTLNTRHWDSCWPVGPLKQPVGEGGGTSMNMGRCVRHAPPSATTVFEVTSGLSSLIHSGKEANTQVFSAEFQRFPRSPTCVHF